MFKLLNKKNIIKYILLLYLHVSIEISSMYCQKNKFQLDSGVHYLNCAYMSPILRASEEACIEILKKERNPMNRQVEEFFEPPREVKSKFARLVGAEAAQVALLSSTSYGFTSVLNNTKGKPHGNAITLKDEFPSGYFSLQRWCQEQDQELKIIGPSSSENVGISWNESLLEEINENTSVVLISTIHWMSGIVYDLEAIGHKCKEIGAVFIVDGTQSVGALPIDVKRCNIHALICATYKWLFGPYGLSLGYIHDDFCDGKPLEEAWLNRSNAQNFAGLTNYAESYTSHAGRYNSGEHSNFLLIAYLQKALDQLLEWNPSQVQQYASDLSQPLLSFLKENGISPDSEVSDHLFSLSLPPSVDPDQLKHSLKENNVFLSVRGEHLRVSVNVFNDENDIDALILSLKNVLL